MRIIVASHNRDKLKEFREILPVAEIDFVSLADLGHTEDIVEDGASYRENALIKARAAHLLCPGQYVIADDSGLSVDLLDGWPGIYSARFAGESTGYVDKIQKLWDLLQPWPAELWTASFHCAIAAIAPTGEEKVFEAQLAGRILPERKGTNGFGYDPVFFLADYARTTAELKAEEKHRLSHRGQALKAWYEHFLAQGGFEGPQASSVACGVNGKKKVSE